MLPVAMIQAALEANQVGREPAEYTSVSVPNDLA